MRILIVDDEVATALFLESIIKEVPGVVTDIVTSGKEALKKASINKPQAIFLDIDMPEMNGIELANILAEKYEDLSFVFATAHPDYALEAFRLYSVDYIIKPFDQERIKKTVRKLITNKSEELAEISLTIKTKDRQIFLKPSNILYVETCSNGNIIKTLNKMYVTKENMGSLEKRLQQYNFFRCHRSYLVNLQYIREIFPSGRTFEILLDREEKIPLSRKQETLLRTKLQQNNT